MLRCHTRGSGRADPDGAGLARLGHDLHRDDLRGRAARGGRRDRGGAARTGSRSPGRRATTPSPGRAMGFCIFDSVAIAARWAQAELGLGRVAILDWDVHHGNGTQAIVGDDPSILFVSLHQWPFYPGSGGPGRAGRDARQPAACRRHRRRGLPGRLRARRAGRDRGLRAGAAARLGRLRRPRRRPARRARALDGRSSRSSRAALRGWRRASPPCSRAATTSRRCPSSSRLRVAASRSEPQTATARSRRSSRSPS